MSTNSFILNGFDRCGSTAIAKGLATHPSVELLFHPFNSGSIRHKMYQVMTDNIASAEDVRFFSELENGRLWREYISSPWFDKHSSVNEFVPGKLHILKTTQNHLTICWMQQRFPGIEFWGIWRDPFDIMASLVRNSFYQKWYADALPQIAVTMKNSKEFPSLFAERLEDVCGREARAVALLIAIRSYFFFKYLDPHKLINYESFKTHPACELNRIFKHFALPEHPINYPMDEDQNVVGLQYKKGENHRNVISDDDLMFANELFTPVFDVMRKRFGEGRWHNPEYLEGASKI